VRRLIINADDFGLTSGVNRAVAEAHHAGRLTSATLMAGAAASGEAIDFSLNTPSLGVGCHVVLLDGKPILAAENIRSITDAQTAAFHPSLGNFLSRLLTGRITAAEIEAEAAAQIAMLHSRGLALTHIDTHKHTHMFPAVLRPVLRAARAAGVTAVRNPFEPAWAMRVTPNAPLARRIQVALLRRLQPAFLRIVAEEGFTTTDGAIGILATGTLDAPTISSLLAHMPRGTWELVTHPGYNDPDLARVRTRLTASRRIELDALQSVKMPSDVQLTTFAALASLGTGRN
jgi:predicted glycoside hydrolase/deacetylase ChbG (UPF0249 family)